MCTGSSSGQAQPLSRAVDAARAQANPAAPQSGTQTAQTPAAGTAGRGGQAERIRRGVPQSTLLAGGLGPIDPLVGQVTLLGS